MLPKRIEEGHVAPGLSHSSLAPVKTYAVGNVRLSSKKIFVKFSTIIIGTRGMVRRIEQPMVGTHTLSG